MRVPGQTYRVTVGVRRHDASSCGRRSAPIRRCRPPTCWRCCSATCRARRTGDAELRALQNPNQPQTDILTTRATQALAGPISSEVGRVVEQTFGVDTFQLTPSFVDPYQPRRRRALNPTARLTIGKRISDRVYLTFSRSLGTIDQRSDRAARDTTRAIALSWILSRNEDSQTYALEFRVRHIF